MVPVDDTALAVTDTGGPGTPVVYLNGHMASQWHWRRVIPELVAVCAVAVHAGATAHIVATAIAVRPYRNRRLRMSFSSWSPWRPRFRAAAATSQSIPSCTHAICVGAVKITAGPGHSHFSRYANFVTNAVAIFPSLP
ncbi:MAG TPA: hypothetical protein VGN81_01490 [Pseudonocardiaceae bacterium]|jgi:hypothetical protein